jgi:hypothetical protein
LKRINNIGDNGSKPVQVQVLYKTQSTIAESNSIIQQKKEQIQQEKEENRLEEQSPTARQQMLLRRGQEFLEKMEEQRKSLVLQREHFRKQQPNRSNMIEKTETSLMDDRIIEEKEKVYEMPQGRSHQFREVESTAKENHSKTYEPIANYLEQLSTTKSHEQVPAEEKKDSKMLHTASSHLAVGASQKKEKSLSVMDISRQFLNNRLMQDFL